MFYRLPSLACLLIAVFGVTTTAAVAENVTVTVADADPVEQINHFISKAWRDSGIKPAPKSTDRVFVRRIYLDLAGRVPTVAEIDAFLADEGENKRTHLVDLLLGSEDHVQHMADVFDVLMMGRAAENKYAQRTQHHWRAYLEDVFRSNRPWNKVVKEVLLARPDDPSKRGAAWFLYERNNKHQEIAESIAPAFFGIRIECAQCHDHMVADEIKQEHYWGLVAFFNRGKNENTKNGPRVAESAIGGFSEFANLSGDSSPNRLTFFAAGTVDEARPGKDEKQQDKDELYRPAPIDGDPRVPKFSRREKFVEAIVEGHSLVPRAFVNRVWAIMMARGIVHPFDEMDSVHDASHPELLDWLSEDFAASGYNIQRLVRSIALSDAYQLDSIRPDGADDPASFAWYLERPLTAEQMSRSIQLVVRGKHINNDPLVGLFRQQLKDVIPDENVVTIGDALFLSNSRQLNEYIAADSGDDSLAGRLRQLSSADEKIQLLFQTIFGRDAGDAEIKAINNHLALHSPEDTANSIHHVIWAMLMSAEFRFNH